MERFITETTCGLVKGHLHNGIVEYLGIPYANCASSARSLPKSGRVCWMQGNTAPAPCSLKEVSAWAARTVSP